MTLSKYWGDNPPPNHLGERSPMFPLAYGQRFSKSELTSTVGLYGISHKYPTYDGAVNTTHRDIVHSTMDMQHLTYCHDYSDNCKQNTFQLLHIHYTDEQHFDAINTVNGRNVIEMNKMYIHVNN